jgi:hypothetical protein
MCKGITCIVKVYISQPVSCVLEVLTTYGVGVNSNMYVSTLFDIGVNNIGVNIISHSQGI